MRPSPGIILKTNFAGDIPTLYHNEGRGVFDDAVREAGLAVENRYVAGGAAMCDLDNDGLADIFIVTGHVYPEIEARFPQFPMRTPRLLFHNTGHGRFEQVWLAPPETPLMIGVRVQFSA